MKKIIIYFLIVFSGAYFSGCVDLDTYPKDQMSESMFWKNEGHVKSALMGVYQVLKTGGNFGENYYFDHCGEINDFYTDLEIPLGSSTSSTGYYNAKWQGSYEGIARANKVIGKVPELDFLSDDEKKEFLAEAKFLRALYYFQLLDFFGGVPYYDETTDINAEYHSMKKPRNTADEIRSYILTDLNAATEGLRAEWDDQNYGRATKGAAYALKGKVYLYNKDWKNAIAAFEEIVYNKSGNYGYALDSDYANLFKLWGGATSPEMIFTLQNLGGIGFDYGSRIQLHLGCRGHFGGGWHNTFPSNVLVDAYEYPDGKPFSWEDVFPGWATMSVADRDKCMDVEMDDNGAFVGLRSCDTAKILNAYKNRDPRLMASVIVPYSTTVGWVSEQTKVLIYAMDGTKNGSETYGTVRSNRMTNIYYYRKFITEGDLGGLISTPDHSPVTIPLIRLADVLLMLSEAYNEDGQLEKAVTELNKVRARVNMPGLNSGSAWLSVTTRDQMFERIRKERMYELCAEGHNYSDLRRWGWEIASAALSNKARTDIKGNLLYTQYFSKKDMLWPIPYQEVRQNPALTQNPEWGQ